MGLSPNLQSISSIIVKEDWRALAGPKTNGLPPQPVWILGQTPSSNFRLLQAAFLSPKLIHISEDNKK